MAAPGRPRLGMFTSGLSSLSQSSDPNSPNVSSPAEQRAGAKANMFQAMRLPTQHVWVLYFDKQAKDQKKTDDGSYQVHFEQLGEDIKSVAEFWRYENHINVEQMAMRDSIYLFKKGIMPVWEDRRNVLGGSWTFRVPKGLSQEFWRHIQVMAIGETLEGVLAKGDQLCGVGLSVRFNSHLISIWHRHSSEQASIDALLDVVLQSLPENLQPKADNYFYKKHSDHAGFKAPPELQAVIDSQKRAQEAAAASAKVAASAPAETEKPAAAE
ncbi:hypothetical protein JX265_011869 [Neoarthrinium moseri]|uniref:Uncharacterized protein n=1 Tax=Neoarthrinium moseri TaxID=1658444 RepID=A0A9Q0AKD5_9PEZI|nr:hypothetical protein JX266_006734 [Neoarthrinium moseri]KAI1856154.1 hypothetical protein JX265_011869 [Neoarthrinium moseri]